MLQSVPPFPTHTMTRWEHQYAGTGDSEVASIDAVAVTIEEQEHADVRITGRSWGGSQNGWDILTINYDDITGDVLWIGRWDSGADDEGVSVTHSQIINGPWLDHIYVAGRILDSSQRWNMVVLRYNRAPVFDPQNNNKTTSWDDPAEIPVYSNSGDEFTTAFLAHVLDYIFAEKKTFWLVGASESGSGTKWRTIQYRDDKP